MSICLDALASRSIGKAASLEETTATMQDLRDKVSQNNISAEKLGSLATTTAAALGRGNHVVQVAQDKMAELSEQSKNQSANIAIIEQIAFQTNLLALNVGFKADRAGQASARFAVVATEIRTIANCAVKFADEMNRLVQESTASIAEGVRKVSDARVDFKEL